MNAQAIPGRLHLLIGVIVLGSLVWPPVLLGESLDPRGFDGMTDEAFAEIPADSFTIAVIPDTQRYIGQGLRRSEPDAPLSNPAFETRVRWLAENLEQHRIVFVSHVGDIVDRNQHDQWTIARACMDQLHGRVPYGISVGNHDMTGAGDSALFQHYFPESRYREFDWYGGTYAGREGAPNISGNNANSYQLITAGGVDLLFLHLECNAPDDVLAWADGVLEAHRDRVAIVTTHMWLGPYRLPREGERRLDMPVARMQWKKVHGERGNTPEQMWDKSLRHHPNLFMILAGDQSGFTAAYQTSVGEHSNTVHELMQDYPRNADDSDWIRLYRFVPSAGVIQVWTYSPAQDRLCDGAGRVPQRTEHQFTLPLPTAFADEAP